jgi:hypothetical protein
MKTNHSLAPKVLALQQPAVTTCLASVVHLTNRGRNRSTSQTSSDSVKPSQSQSNLVKPNPTTPSPSGKEIGKETVKYLAIFDHPQRLPGILSHALRFTQHEADFRLWILPGAH